MINNLIFLRLLITLDFIIIVKWKSEYNWYKTILCIKSQQSSSISLELNSCSISYQLYSDIAKSIKSTFITALTSFLLKIASKQWEVSLTCFFFGVEPNTLTSKLLTKFICLEIFISSAIFKNLDLN